MDLVVGAQQCQVGALGGQHEGVGGRAGGEERRALGGPTQPLVGDRTGGVSAQQRDCHGGMLGDRLGAGGIPEFLERQHEVEGRHVEAAVRLRGGDAEHPGGGKGLPESGDTTVGVLPGGPHRRWRALIGEDVPDGLGEHHLVVGEGELHGPVPYFLGRPSTRSAMMLRWISLVPA